jgi:hypothetical protein
MLFEKCILDAMLLPRPLPFWGLFLVRMLLSAIHVNQLLLTFFWGHTWVAAKQSFM